jgi:hypothetical protein
VRDTTRGWEVLAWSHRFLPSPSDPSRPLVLSDEQARFVIRFDELDDGSYLCNGVRVDVGGLLGTGAAEHDKALCHPLIR